MTQPDTLFQFQSTDASTDLTDGQLVFTAPTGGITMMNNFMVCGSSGGASNYYRIYHTGPEEDPSVSNMIVRAGCSATAKNVTGMINNTKIIMNPGDKIFCQLHSGDGITITGYGLVPVVYNLRPDEVVENETSDNVSMPSSGLRAYK